MFAPEFINGYEIDRYVHNMKYAWLKGDALSLPASAGMRVSPHGPGFRGQ